LRNKKGFEAALLLSQILSFKAYYKVYSVSPAFSLKTAQKYTSFI